MDGVIISDQSNFRDRKILILRLRYARDYDILIAHQMLPRLFRLIYPLTIFVLSSWSYGLHDATPTGYEPNVSISNITTGGQRRED